VRDLAVNCRKWISTALHE